MLSALGAVLTDADGRELVRGGGALTELAHLDLSGLHPALAAAELVLACDVVNPLLGPSGAVAVYGGQKGAAGAVAGLAILINFAVELLYGLIDPRLRQS